MKERLEVAERALATLFELCDLPQPSPVERDAAIQRFEYTLEAVWRTAQRYLLIREGLDLASPKACVRAVGQLVLLDEAQVELALEMIDDRNLSVHTYSEALAVALFGRLSRHAAILSAWLAAMKTNVG